MRWIVLSRLWRLFILISVAPCVMGEQVVASLDGACWHEPDPIGLHKLVSASGILAKFGIQGPVLSENKEQPCVPQSYAIIWTSPTPCLVLRRREVFQRTHPALPIHLK